MPTAPRPTQVGSQLVRVVQAAVWPRRDLTDRARLVLAVMASVAHDQDEQPVYFAGWAPLALALGYSDPQPSSDAQRAVTRALRCLTDAGLITADPDKPRHHKRRYRLHLPLGRVDARVR